MNEVMTQETSYPVVMHNDLIRSKSNLGLNETKLLRLTIMQIVREDTDFQTYEVGISDLAELLGIDRHNMYQAIDSITTNLMRELVIIGDGNPKNKWQKFHWVSMCKYSNGVLTIRLHDELKPYLIGLKQLYTSYMLNDVLILKSLHSIRLYELLREQIRQLVFGNHRADVYLSMETVRKATNTEDKYKDNNMFFKRVIRAAVDEINEKLQYHVEVTPRKRGRKFIGYDLQVYDSIYWNEIRGRDIEKRIDEKLKKLK